MGSRKLVLIGNGFDLAHGLKTSYYDFIINYLKKSVIEFNINKAYEDDIIKISKTYANAIDVEQVFSLPLFSVLEKLQKNDYRIQYKTTFSKALIETFSKFGWVDIERFYFKFVKELFKSTLTEEQKHNKLQSLNASFNCLKIKLTDYLKVINNSITEQKIFSDSGRFSISHVFHYNNNDSLFVNFNYTDTLVIKEYVDERECVFRHGRISKLDENPIIFGYGDESDPVYQEIEDSGENLYLDHIKSFAYFTSTNYQKILNFIDSGEQFEVYIVGHSCGLSDRVLLKDILESSFCKEINVFFHKRNDDTDNFKLITQEISRHFSSTNKGVMRRKILSQSSLNYIPQYARLNQK